MKKTLSLQIKNKVLQKKSKSHKTKKKKKLGPHPRQLSNLYKNTIQKIKLSEKWTEEYKHEEE